LNAITEPAAGVIPQEVRDDTERNGDRQQDGETTTPATSNRAVSPMNVAAMPTTIARFVTGSLGVPAL